MVKNLFILSLLALVTSCKTNTIYLESKFIPGKEYLETTIIITEKADTAIGLSSNYVKPNINRDTLVAKSLIKTGVKKVNKFPISYSELNIMETKYSVDQISYGWVNENGIVDLDSIMVRYFDPDESWKNEELEFNESILNTRLPFSGKLSVGDTVKIKSFRDFYIGSDTYFFELEMDEILKLIQIKDGIAYFDIQYDFSLSPVDSKYDRRISYMGKGKAEFDIKNSIITKYIKDMLIDYTYKYNGKLYESYSKKYYQETIEIKN